MAVVTSINEANLSLLQQLSGSTSRTSQATSVANILQVAQTAYAQRDENRQQVIDQLGALTDLNTKVSKLRETASDLDANGKVLNVFNGQADTSTIRSSIDAFVEAFNDTRTFAKENASFFLPDISKALSSAVQYNALDLQELGISVESDGTLSIDSDTLDAALADNPSAVRDTLGSVTGLATRVEGVAASLQRSPSYTLLTNIEVPERPSRAVELLQDEFFRNSLLSILS